MKVGSTVVVMRATAVNKAGGVGICYADYGSGFGLIFEGGGYDGFSPEDIKIFGVRELGVCEAIAPYQFTNVLNLWRDYEAGFFASAFKQAHKELHGGEAVKKQKALSGSLIVSDQRDQVLATALLLNLIHAKEVKVQLFKDGHPGAMTETTLEGMGLAATALCVVYGITEGELEKFTEETLRKAERTN